MACEGLDSLEVAETWRPFFDWVKARPTDFTVTDPLWANAWDARGSWDPSARSFNHDLRDGAPKHHVWKKSNTDECGAFLYGYDSLWLPASLLEKSRQNQLTEALFAASRHEMVRFHINEGMAGAPPEVLADVSQTATHPALLEAFTLAIVADGDWTPTYPGFVRSPLDMAKAREKARGINGISGAGPKRSSIVSVELPSPGPAWSVITGPLVEANQDACYTPRVYFRHDQHHQ